jgi:hypothetical protein
MLDPEKIREREILLGRLRELRVEMIEAEGVELKRNSELLEERNHQTIKLFKEKNRLDVN